MGQKLMSESLHRTNIWSARIHVVIETMGVDGIAS